MHKSYHIECIINGATEYFGGFGPKQEIYWFGGREDAAEYYDLDEVLIDFAAIEEKETAVIHHLCTSVRAGK